jgi:hypothetical protein
VALEQLRPGPSLEPLQAPRERGLRRVQRPRRGRDPAMVGDGEERFEVTRILH